MSDSIDDILAIADASADTHTGATGDAGCPKRRPAGPQTVEREESAQVDASTAETPSAPILWPEIRQMIEDGIRSQPREQQKEIGPSELGTDCLHCLAAKLAGWQHHARQTAWLPFVGTCVHAHFERQFRLLGSAMTVGDGIHRFETELRVHVGTINGINRRQPVSGSIDLLDRQTHATVDWKIVGTTTLRSMRANGPSQQYRVQASLYGIGLQHMGEPIHTSAIYSLPRNAVSLDDAYIWETQFDPEPGRWALRRASLILALLDIIRWEHGDDMADAWIHSLPRSRTHCFDCGTWADDWMGDQTDMLDPNARDWPTIPDEWRQRADAIPATYTPTSNDNLQGESR